ncbi:MAG: lycopene cyclase family protein [Actinomycetota bacterium]
MPRHDADLIIAGAGCAGLSALHFALQHESDRRIVVIDRSFEPSDDRTWAFWGTAQAPFANLADRRWDHLRVKFPTWSSTQRLQRPHDPASTHRRTYMRVRRRNYDAAILCEAESRPNVRFVAQDILAVTDDRGGNGGIVSLPEGELRAPLVLQSALAPRRPGTTELRHPLRQHFGGWEVVTDRPVFDPDVATLMDFDTAQHDAVSFVYVLPEAPNRALVEHTTLSTEVKDREFHGQCVADYLYRLGVGEFDVVRTEYGVIPMEDAPPAQRHGRHVWNVGTVGGGTKPSSGYTFARTHIQTEHLIRQWADGAALTPPPARPRRFAFADRTLLHILHRQPELGRPVFERLFRSTSIDDVLTFLDERSSLGADARMVAALPQLPFLRAAASEIAADVRSRWSAR